MRNTLFTTLVLLCALSMGFTQPASSLRISFYNVENLFDIKNDPITIDDDFTPEGKQQWTRERYQTKLNRLSQVLDSMGVPTFLGLAEVENLAVVKDLAKTGALKEVKYGFVHKESPDKRGIDVAFMYDKKQFKLISYSFIRIDFPEEIEVGYTSRDILHAEGRLSSGDTLHFFVNHWPSRRGGVAQSEPKRMWVAQHLRFALDDIFKDDPDANVIIMGDFNDETDNKSITSMLNAQPRDAYPEDGKLYNCFSEFDQQELGSYRYRANWNALDQIIVSGSLLNGEASVIAANPVIFRRDWMMYNSSKYGPSPNRTYGGPNYYGGYSDHLPVTMELIWK